MNNITPSSSHIDATSRIPASGARSLVLGGGGSTGNAWMIGIIAGLYDAGLDVTAPDLTIGTSAGSTVAAQIAGAAPHDLLAATLTPPLRDAGHSRPGSATGRSESRSRPLNDHLEKFKAVIAASSDPADMRRRMGAAALSAGPEADAAWQTQWHDTVASRLPCLDWPEHTVLITAVDAGTGEPVVFDRDSGVDLVDAVAASCAGGGLAYRIGEGWYIDGGYRAYAENADLATGYQRVVVLSPLSGRSLYPEEWGTRLATHVEELRAGGSRVETIFPSTDAAHLFTNPMDYSLRAPAARAGHEQGLALADQLSDFW